MKLQYTALVITFLMYTGYGDVASETTVNDEDKTSSNVNNMFTTIEYVEKAAKVVKGAKETKKTIGEVKNIKNLGDVKDLGVDKLKSSLSSLVFKYKPAKTGFLFQLSQYTKKIEKILGDVSDKLNKWNTTLPTIRAYGEASRKMLDNTVEVYNDFRWKDLWDIDRKWDRRVEGIIDQANRTYIYFSSYMINRYNEVNERERKESIQNYFLNLFMYSDNIQDGDYLDVLSTTHEHRLLPTSSLYNAAEALSMTNQIINMRNSINSRGITDEEQSFEDITEAISNGKRTMQDERQIQAMIEMNRNEVALQQIQLNQVLTNLMQRYARLELRRQEIGAMQSERYINSLDVFTDTKKQEFKTLEEYRAKLVSPL